MKEDDDDEEKRNKKSNDDADAMHGSDLALSLSRSKS